MGYPREVFGTRHSRAAEPSEPTKGESLGDGSWERVEVPSIGEWHRAAKLDGLDWLSFAGRRTSLGLESRGMLQFEKLTASLRVGCKKGCRWLETRGVGGEAVEIQLVGNKVALPQCPPRPIHTVARSIGNYETFHSRIDWPMDVHCGAAGSTRGVWSGRLG